MRFITYPIWLASNAIEEKTAPSIWYSGAPGGCPTCSFAEVKIYSPESQKLTVGSAVIL